MLSFAILATSLTQADQDFSYAAAQKKKFVPYYMKNWIQKAGCDDCGDDDCSSDKREIIKVTYIRLMQQKTQAYKA